MSSKKQTTKTTKKQVTKVEVEPKKVTKAPVVRVSQARVHAQLDDQGLNKLIANARREQKSLLDPKYKAALNALKYNKVSEQVVIKEAEPAKIVDGQGVPATPAVYETKHREITAEEREQ